MPQTVRYDGGWEIISHVRCLHSGGSAESYGVERGKAVSTTEQLCSMLRQREERGLAKYGVTVDRTDLTPAQWLQHSIEEQLDNLQYTMRLRDEIVVLCDRCARLEAVADHMLAYLETACHKETGEHFARMLREAREVKP